MNKIIFSKTTKLGEVFDEKLTSFENNNRNKIANVYPLKQEQQQQHQKLTSDDELLQPNYQSQTTYHQPYKSKVTIQSISLMEDESSSGSSSTQENATGSIWTTIIAKVVTAYRQEESMGKLGLALLINQDGNCKLIIYRSKTQILGSILLQKHKDILSKHRKYWQFYDENRIYWSLYFNDERDEGEFLEQLLTKGYHLIMPTDDLSVDEQQLTKNLEKLSDSSTSETESSMSRITQCSPLTRLSQLSPTTGIQKSISGIVNSSKGDLDELSSEIEVIKRIETYNGNNKILNGENTHHSSIVSASSNYKDNTTSCSKVPLNTQFESQYIQMMLTEQRTLGSELRMNVNRLSEKTEMILSKLDVIDKQTSSNIAINSIYSREDDLLEFEERLLNLKKENRKLKLSLEDAQLQTPTADSYTKEILSQLSESLNNLNITKSTDIKVILNDLVEKCQQNNEALNKMSGKLRNTNASYEENLRELTEVKLLIQKLQHKIKSTQDNETTMRQQLEELERTNEQLKLELQVAKSEFETKLEEKSEDLECTVKTIMNELYLDIASRLQTDDQSNELTHRLLGIIGATIRHQTLKTLKATQ